MRAYFDYNASSPLRPEAATAMADAAAQSAGNPSSSHAEGRRCRALIEAAREDLATLLGVSPRRVLFTSGATEANNTVLRGFLAMHPDGEIFTTATEHHSIIATAAALAERGAAVQLLNVDSDGQPDLEPLARNTGQRPRLVSSAAANGETGHITDLRRVRAALGDPGLLHVDAAQAVGRVEIPSAARFDLLSLSAHKFGGPKGVGALVIPDDLSWHPLLTGGPQERALRAGTENVLGVVGMGAAAKACRENLAPETERIRDLRDRLWAHLESGAAGDGGWIRLTPANGLPNTLTVAVPDIGSDVLVAGLDLAGFAVSAGSACAAGSPEPSHVVKALGVAERYRHGILRISLGHATTAAETERCAKAFLNVVDRARQAA